MLASCNKPTCDVHAVGYVGGKVGLTGVLRSFKVLRLVCMDVPPVSIHKQ